MINATNFEKYDFKAKGWDKKTTNNIEMLKHYYRGSLDSNGDIGSACDFGNIGAGLVAARSVFSWNEARAGFDSYQGYKTNGFTSVSSIGLRGIGTGIPIRTILPVREAKTSVMAQMVGYLRGAQKFNK